MSLIFTPITFLTEEVQNSEKYIEMCSLWMIIKASNSIKMKENRSLSDSCRQTHPRIVLRLPVLLPRSS